eukprot:1158738-Pelagomonas_calceolata.AAC.3
MASFAPRGGPMKREETGIEDTAWFSRECLPGCFRKCRHSQDQALEGGGFPVFASTMISFLT